MVHKLFTRNKKLALWAVLAVGGLLALSFFVASPRTFADKWYPPSCPHYAYFSGGKLDCPSGGNDVDPNHFHQSTNKATFINDVESSSAKGFYVDLIIGKPQNSSGGHNYPSSADILDFEARVNDPNIGIKLKGSASLGVGCNNTMKYGGDYYSICDREDFQSIVLYNKTTGKQYTIIKIDCGNPLNATPLPPPSKPKPPTGKVIVTCNPNSTADVNYRYSDPNSPGNQTRAYASVRPTNNPVTNTQQSGNSLQANSSWNFHAYGTSAQGPQGYSPTDGSSTAWIMVEDVDDTGQPTRNAANGGTYYLEDSAKITCTQPGSNLSGKINATCNRLTGDAFDSKSPNNNIDYYIVINPNNTPSSYPNYQAFNSAQDIYTQGTLKGKGDSFSVGLPSRLVHGYKGVWQSNTYYLYARESTVVEEIGHDSPNGGNPCATLNCTSADTDFSAATVSQPVTFKVWMTTNQYGDTPLPDQTFTITITDPSGNSQPPITRQAYLDKNAQQIYSGTVRFTPTRAGKYKLAWDYDGQHCSTSNTAGYAPFFSVLGGDIAAGPGFGNGCTPDNTAIIQGWNKDSGSYFGAGSWLAALAEGQIKSFASAQNNVSNASPPRGLSFSNQQGVGSTGQDGGHWNQNNWCVPDYVSQATQTDTASDINTVDYATPGTRVYNLSGNQNFNGAVLQPGVKVTVVVNGDVFIGGGVTYASYSQIDQIPEFELLVTGNIYINGSISQLHGFYDAQPKVNGAGRSLPNTGEFHTCARALNQPTTDYSTCDTHLTIYGAVSAGSMFLERTRGNLVKDPINNVTNEPAETFEFTPELWLANGATPTTLYGILPYNSITSLPPVL